MHLKNWKKNIPICALFLFIAGIILIKPIENLDELWNYNFARNITDGLIPYLDFNMLQTPLLPMITSLFLHVLGNELWVTRILAIFLATGITWQFFQILQKGTEKTYLSWLITFIFVWGMKEYFCLDYNFAILFLVLTMIRMEWSILGKTQKTKKWHFFLGILAGITVGMKQSTGILIAGVTLLIPLTKILSFSSEGETKKEIVKQLGLRFLGLSIPIVLVISYIAIQGAFYDFIDYCFLGIKTFANKISYLTLWKEYGVLGKLLMAIVPLGLLVGIFMGILKKKNIFSGTTEKIGMLILSLYGIAEFSVAYPISDQIHFQIGATIGILAVVLLIVQLSVKVVSKYQNMETFQKGQRFLSFFLEAVALLITLLFLYKGMSGVINYIQMAGEYTNLSHFSGIPIAEGLENRVEKINKWILEQKAEGKEVSILDAEAALYHIPFNCYQKDYDMFLKGNLGGEGEEGQIQKLQETKNRMILIRKEGVPRNWQNPEEVRKYIQNQYFKIGSIEIFDIYEIP